MKITTTGVLFIKAAMMATPNRMRAKPNKARPLLMLEKKPATWDKAPVAVNALPTIISAMTVIRAGLANPSNKVWASSWFRPSAPINGKKWKIVIRLLRPRIDVISIEIFSSINSRITAPIMAKVTHIWNREISSVRTKIVFHNLIIV